MPDRAAIEQFVKDVGHDAALELFGLFHSDAQHRLSEIEARKHKNDVSREFRRHAHSLKGICRNYGLPHAGELAYKLEQAIDANDQTAIVEAAEKVLAEVPGEVEAAMKLAGEVVGQIEN